MPILLPIPIQIFILILLLVSLFRYGSDKRRYRVEHKCQVLGQYWAFWIQPWDSSVWIRKVKRWCQPIIRWKTGFGTKNYPKLFMKVILLFCSRLPRLSFESGDLKSFFAIESVIHLQIILSQRRKKNLIIISSNLVPP